MAGPMCPWPLCQRAVVPSLCGSLSSATSSHRKGCDRAVRLRLDTDLNFNPGFQASEAVQTLCDGSTGTTECGQRPRQVRERVWKSRWEREGGKCPQETRFRGRPSLSCVGNARTACVPVPLVPRVGAGEGSPRQAAARGSCFCVRDRVTVLP